MSGALPSGCVALSDGRHQVVAIVSVSCDVSRVWPTMGRAALVRLARGLTLSGGEDVCKITGLDISDDRVAIVILSQFRMS